MNFIRGFLAFWYDFIVGDDWTVAVAVAIGLIVSAILNSNHIPAWWLIPVIVVLNNVVSNITTMSISSKGAVCTEQGIGLSLADLQQMVSNNSARVGNITLTRTDLTLIGPNGQQQSRVDSGIATFTNLTPAQFVATPGSIPPSRRTLSGTGHSPGLRTRRVRCTIPTAAEPIRFPGSPEQIHS